MAPSPTLPDNCASKRGSRGRKTGTPLAAAVLLDSAAMSTPRPDTQDFASLFLDDIPLLDVRAPVEFSKGAFPHADNLPLIDNDERHRIGICYKQSGQQAAIDLGNRLVTGAIREARLEAWKAWWQAHPSGYLYCFRGGLRSQTTQQWLREAGVDAPLVKGGYKALRRFLLESMDRQLARLHFTVLSGRTGCGKTRVIERLHNAVDLEGLAHHRGSAFGRRPAGQPAQIDFENGLAIALLKQQEKLKQENQRPATVVLEDESKLIGHCYLPPALQERIKTAPRVMIEETLENRVQVTLEDYVIGPLAEYAEYYGEEQAFKQLSQSLLEAMDRIRRRLGGSRHQDLRAKLEAALAQQSRNGATDQHRGWIAELLSGYYDPMYDYGLKKHRDGDVLFRGTRAEALEYLR